MDDVEALTTAAREADGRHGVISRVRLRELGLTDRMIDGLIDHVLESLGRGVFRFVGSGHSDEQRLAAALLAVPRGAAARRWALWLHGLLDAAPGGRPCVLVPYGASVRGGERLCLHRSRSFQDTAVQVERDFRVVSVERALIESWPELPPGAWRRCLRRALQRGCTDVPRLEAAVSELGRVRGSGAIIRDVRREPAQAGRARSTGELALLGAFARAGLPEPTLNLEVRTHGGQRRELDAAFPDLRLAYELDGRDWHSAPDQVDHDHLRDLELAATGWAIHRVPARLLSTPTQLERLLRTTFDAHLSRS